MLIEEKKPRKNLARRERLNPDWPQAVLAFPAFPLGPLPQAVWDNAKLMNQLWNELVDIFERASALDRKDEENKPVLSKEDRRAVWLPFGQRKTSEPPLAEIPDNLKQLLSLTDDRIDAILESSQDELLKSLDAKILRARLGQTVKSETYARAAKLWGGTVPSLAAVGARYKGLMPSAYYESVIARFIVTVKEWQEKPARKKPAQKKLALKGPPRKHHGLRSINLPVLYNTGTTLTDLQCGVKASLRYTEHLKGANQRDYRENGHICVGINNVPVPLHVAYSRPQEAQAFRANHAHKAIPDQHRIKRVSLVGHHTPALGWEWSYQIQIEHAPNHTPRQVTERGCGLDVGWRMREDGLRIACLADTEGRVIEFILPFAAIGREERRNAEKFGADYTAHDWRAMPERHAQLDAAKDACKAALKELDRTGWPAEAKAVFNGYDKLGLGGLRKLLALLPPEDAAHPILTQWWEEHRIQARRVYGAEARLGRIWADARKQLAAWIATEYDVIVHEEGLKLKDIAETWTSAYAGALDQARKWRQRASLSEFRQWLRLQTKKHKSELRDGGTAYSTQTCYQCGGAITPDSKLLLVCENGHTEDQDANASSLFCKQLEWPAGTSAKPLSIPSHLRGYVRIISGPR